MKIVFSDKNINAGQLYPFALTRNIEDIRIGIFTMREKWMRLLSTELNKKTLQKASKKRERGYIIAANLLPDEKLLASIKKLKPGDKIYDDKNNLLVECIASYKTKSAEKLIRADVLKIEYPWQIFQYNAKALAFDFELARTVRKSAHVGRDVFVRNKKNVFIEKGTKLNNVIINAEDGPVFIAKNALIMEGALLRGPLYIGEGAVVKMGAKIYGATTIGPFCTVGGEIKNTVIFGYSNKAHDGYLGDSVIGEWCNMGAGTSNSNLKNTAGNIAVHLQDEQYDVGTKCGVLMGDFSRTAINTSINTGTVIGVSVNVFGNGLTPKYIPSFSWGFDDTMQYKLEKALNDANNWKQLKGSTLTTSEIEILTKIYKSKIQIK